MAEQDDRAVLKAIFQTYDTDKENTHRFVDYPSSTLVFRDMISYPREEDHFLEMEHAIDILYSSGILGGDALSIPIGYFVDLATMLGQPDNRFLINKAHKLAKKHIKIGDYRSDDRINDYLGLITAKPHGSRRPAPAVNECVKFVVREMINRNTTYNFLTTRVKQHATILGYTDLRVSMDEMKKHGDLETVPPWKKS